MRLRIAAQMRALELTQYSEKLPAMLVGVAGGERYGDDAAQQARPESVDELLVALEQQYHFAARVRTARLKMMEQAESAFVELAKAQRFLVVLAFDVGDGARA